ncbi:hypothetical protein H6F90_29860 [Trichocoleus sp. FACHB-591]|uniref:hypothetical protein n=1 Tax=Trichocoleus sp. FACHB-591 TaxID=2692872 RepID=UPI001688E95D|nr:hypothetical protein [Trichocoleus sp. FACHB-591]MBD2099273.1 hypothetical protein [Trichocoleus sp. FACHB-591]
MTTHQTENIAPKASKKYTTVVYFHGMGRQRRFAELSRLVDRLDQHANFDKNQNLREVPRLRKIRAKIEPSRICDLSDDVAFIELDYIHSKDGKWHRDSYRFYEVYWAYVTAGGVPLFDVIAWLFNQTLNPIRSILSPWRSRARLRRTYLHNLWSTLQGDPSKFSEKFQQNDLKKLVEYYDQFESPGAWHDYPRGTFSDFIQFLKRSKSTNRSALITLAKKWHCYYLKSEFFNQIYLLTLALILLLAGLTLLTFAFWIFQQLGLVGLPKFLIDQGLESVSQLLTPSWSSVFVLALALSGVLGLTTFLQDFMGDVQFWATYAEDNEKYKKRQEILNVGVHTLKHVLMDDSCERVVVVAHSLGSAVAYDVLRRLGQYSRAHAKQTSAPALPVEKLDQFFTMGCPIDKIHYFFESEVGQYHRYNRVKEQIWGDMGAAPFSRNFKPHIHWVNFWDQADIIGGALESPVHRRLRTTSIDNVEVFDSLFPSPISSHSAYFENRNVIGIMFDAIFNSKYSFRSGPHEKLDYQQLLLGPGNGLITTRVLQGLTIVFPWLILTNILAVFFKASDSLKIVFNVGILVILALFLIVWLIAKRVPADQLYLWLRFLIYRPSKMGNASPTQSG